MAMTVRSGYSRRRTSKAAQSIHDRHPQVQKDAVRHRGLDPFERLLPVRGGLDREVVGLQDRLQQQAECPGHHPPPGAASCAHLRLGRGEREAEGTALPQLTPHPHLPPVELDQLFGDRQP